MALIYIVIKARKPEKNPDKNVKSPKPKKDRKCEDRNNPTRGAAPFMDAAAVIGREEEG